MPPVIRSIPLCSRSLIYVYDNNCQNYEFSIPTPKPVSFGIWLAIILVMGTTIGMFDYGYQNVQARSSDDDDDDDDGNSYSRDSDNSYSSSSIGSSSSSIKECKSNLNDFGDFANLLVPGVKIFKPIVEKAIC